MKTLMAILAITLCSGCASTATELGRDRINKLMADTAASHYRDVEIRRAYDAARPPRVQGRPR